MNYLFILNTFKNNYTKNWRSN